MVTAEQNRLNLKSASNVVRTALGIAATADAALTYEQRQEYNRALAAKILEFPAGFVDATLATARDVLGKTYEPLADPKFSVEDFAKEYTAPIAAAGTGAASALNSVQWLLPVALLVAVAILLLAFGRKVRAL